jgi:hypothetical protein
MGKAINLGLPANAIALRCSNPECDNARPEGASFDVNLLTELVVDAEGRVIDHVQNILQTSPDDAVCTCNECGHEGKLSDFIVR